MKDGQEAAEACLYKCDRPTYRRTRWSIETAVLFQMKRDC